MIERTVNGDVFLTLVQKILVSELSQEELSLSIILAHTRLKESEKPLKLLEQRGDLPAYCPEWNLSGMLVRNGSISTC